LLPELKDGVTREEFSALIAQINPNYTLGSIGTTINVISREFDICKREGDVYQLSARGLNLLDTQDPDELADHLVTRILGIDNLLKKLESEPQTKAQLVSFLQSVHPGWTSDFAPLSMLGWLSSLNVIELNDARKYQLTERGHRWAEMVTWTPQILPKPVETVEEFKAAATSQVKLPTVGGLLERLQKITSGKLMLDDQLVGQLHGGLWFHPIRHFVVLTGISGSGKTQLALNYALALCDAHEADQEQVRVIPVQPGWYDPSPLLGYVNPIQDTSYRSAPFLELLQRAAGDPDRPYVAILDEMNLSHPEQYLAPILSAMETHGWIEIHQLDADSTSVKQRIQYPANLAIIGTVNMDETTHGLSDKVLDRAYTLEFWNINVNDFPGWATISLPGDVKEATRSLLDQLVKALDPVRLHFGWRTIDDVLSFLTFQLEHNQSAKDSLDSVIYAKVLPKLRGEGTRFQKVLQDVNEILLSNGLKRCADKVKSMQADLVETGSARFWR
jgi:DNA-binding PadR family transcriptional regulator